MMNLTTPLSRTLCPIETLELAAPAPWPPEGIAVRWLRPEDEFDHDLCRRLSGLAGLPKAHAAWQRHRPDPARPPHCRTLVGTVDGLLVGRAVLEAPWHPYCELVNLCVRADYRRRGVATAIVAESIRLVRAMGLKYMVLQTDREGPAIDLYARAGFLRATVGEMQRMIHLLDVPLVSGFLLDHPQATLESEAAGDWGERWWRLAWREGDDCVELLLHGGSSQFDSDGLQAVVQAAQFVRGDTGLAARVDMPAEVVRGAVIDAGNGKLVPNGPAEMTVTLHNLGAQSLTLVVRAVLPESTALVGEHAQAPPRVELGPGEEATVALGLRAEHDFACDHLRFLSYPSTPFTVEVCWEGGSVLLSAAVRVR